MLNRASIDDPAAIRDTCHEGEQMSGAFADLGADPFLSWIQDAVSRHGPGDPNARDDLGELRALASEIENEISPFTSSGATEVRPGLFLRVKAMDPQWLARWLSFDPDLGTEVDQHPRQPIGHNAALIDNTTISLVAEHIENERPPNALGLLDR